MTAFQQQLQNTPTEFDPSAFRDETDLLIHLHRESILMKEALKTISSEQEKMSTVLLDYKLFKAKIGGWFFAANVVSGVLGFILDKLLK